MYSRIMTDVKEIIKDFQDTGTEVEKIQYLEIDGVYMLGMEFATDPPDDIQQRISDKLAHLFPEKEVLVMVMKKDVQFKDIAQDNEEWLRKTIEARSE